MSTKESKRLVFKVCTGLGTGSGFVVDGHPYVITNSHVVAGSRRVAIECQDRVRRSADVVLIDPAADIALLRAESLPEGGSIGFRLAELPPKVGDVSLVHGFPLGMPYSVSQGVVSAVEQPLEDRRFIQTDAAVNPGNSGGPMVNGSGDVFGITACKVREAENIGFAIPIDHLVEDLELCRSEGLETYTLKCPSCSSALSEPDEYCADCGVELDQDQFFPSGALSPLAEIVEGALAVEGYDPVLARQGYHNWELMAGSASIECLMVSDELLCVRTSLAMLPKKPEDVLRFVMAYDHPDYTFVVGESGRIWLRGEMHLSDVFHPSRRETIARKISRLGTVADEMDNRLIETFGCTPSPETYTGQL